MRAALSVYQHMLQDGSAVCLSIKTRLCGVVPRVVLACEPMWLTPWLSRKMLTKVPPERSLASSMIVHSVISECTGLVLDLAC